MSMDPRRFAGPVQVNHVPLPPPKVFHLANWHALTDVQKVAFLRQVAEEAGRDPRMRLLATRILAEYRVPVRDYRAQAAAFLHWTQTRLRYLNEAGEVIQDPVYTIQTGAAPDCDDMATVFCALCVCAALPNRFVLSGIDRKTGAKLRWVEGTPLPRDAEFSHIYAMVGAPPFRPMIWWYAEPTLQVPLGWDVIQAYTSGQGPKLPEIEALKKMRAQQQARMSPGGRPGFPMAPAPAAQFSGPPSAFGALGAATSGPGGQASAATAATSVLDPSRDRPWHQRLNWDVIAASVLVSVLVGTAVDVVRDWRKGTPVFARGARPAALSED